MFKLYKRHNSLLRCTQGSIAIEFAVIGTVLSFAVIGVIDYGTIISAKSQINAALSTGSRFALTNPASLNDVLNVVDNATALPLNAANITVTQFCECAGVSTACNANCGSVTPEKYTSIAVNYQVNLLMGAPGWGNPYPLSETAIIRVE